MKRCLFFIIGILALGQVFPQQISKDIRLTDNDVMIKSVTEDFVRIELLNSQPEGDTGSPELPVLKYLFVVPLNAENIHLNITHTSKMRLSGTYHVFPVQPPLYMNYEDDERDFQYNAGIYSSSQEFPEKTAEIVADKIESGYRLIEVAAYPISYIPGNREVFLKSLNFNIEYTLRNHNELQELTYQSQYRAESALINIQSKVENPEDAETFSPDIRVVNQRKNIVEQDTTKLIQPLSSDLYEQLIPDYIIITSENLKDSFKPLADWKTKKGVLAIIKTVEDIYENYPGLDRPEQIRNYLIECYNKWGSDIYLLIGGNTNMVPVRFVRGIATDLYYATVNGTWYNRRDYYNSPFSYSDDGHNFYIGRAPVQTTEDVANFIRKVLAYEKAEVDNKGYYNNFLSTWAFTERGRCEGYADASQIRHNAYGYLDMYTDLNNWRTSLIPSHIRSKLMIDNYDCSRQVFTYRSADVLCTETNNQKVPEPTPADCIPGDYEMNNTNFSNQLNYGKPHIIYHLDHSSYKNLGTSSKDKVENFTGAEARNLQNGNYLQFMYSKGCDDGAFQIPDCFGAEYINSRTGGGVAFYGSTGFTARSYYEDFENFLNFLYNDNSINNLGFILKNTPMSLGSKSMFNLLGDPEMQIFTKEPKQITATCNIWQQEMGSVQLTVKVTSPIQDDFPREGVRICIMKGTDYYFVGRITRPGQIYTYRVNSFTTDKINVTITGKNCIPFTQELNVATNAISPKIEKINIYDGNENRFCDGNGNGQIDAGELIAFKLDIAIDRSAPRDFLKKARLIKFGVFPEITLHKDTVDYLNPRDEKFFSVHFHRDILTERGLTEMYKNDYNAFPFVLEMQDQYGNKYYDSFTYDIFDSKLEQGKKRLVFTDDGEYTYLDIFVELFNSGKSPVSTLRADLIIDVSNSYCTPVSNTNIQYPAIASKETKENNAGFRFHFKNGYGYPRKWILEARDMYGKIWTFDLDLYDIPVMNFSGLEFKSTENTITLQWWKTPVQNPYLNNKYNIYRSESFDGVYKKINIWPATYLEYTDYDVEPLKTYYYKVAPVSDKGNEGQTSYPLKAWTTFPSDNIFPVRISSNMVEPKCGPVTVFDANGDMKKEIFTTIRDYRDTKSLIIGLKSNGEELFNIDGNETTNSGFAYFDRALYSGVAVGPYGTQSAFSQDPQIIAATRNIDSQPNILASYSLQDDGQNRPRPRWQKQEYWYQTHEPVLANLDDNSVSSMEVLLLSDDATLKVLENNGNVRWQRKIPSLADRWPMSKLAVGKQSANGSKMIVVGSNDGVYIISATGIQRKIFSRAGYTFDRSAPIICDLDGDGYKEIIIRGTKQKQVGDITEYITTIFVFDFNGVPKGNWGTTQDTFISDKWFENCGISVGAEESSGNIYVIEQGKDVLKVWDKNGALIMSQNIPGLALHASPIIADIDGDYKAEILVTAKNQILSFKFNGTLTTGFPINVEYDRVRIAAADLNGTGYTDLIANSAGNIYVWRTKGYSRRIEWGMERFDAQYTGEYNKTYSIIPQNENGGDYNMNDRNNDFDREDCILYQNTPNPFNGSTEISYYVPCEGCTIELQIYNMQGSLLKTYTGLPAGSEQVTIESGNLSAGIYLYTLVVNGETIDTKRMAVTK